MSLPFSQSCENNKQVIVEQLKQHFANSKQVLEIGSGTGQHAIYFAPRLKHLVWQTSDREQNHSAVNQWLEAYPAINLRRPISFTLGQDKWPSGEFDAVFSANTAHIMQQTEVQELMALLGQKLPRGGVFCQYGPFNIDGQYTSASNQQFDQQLIEQGCGGIRDIAQLQDWAVGLTLVNKIQMPANNMLLVWRQDTHAN